MEPRNEATLRSWIASAAALIIWSAALQCGCALPRRHLPPVFCRGYSGRECRYLLALFRARSIRAETSLGTPVAAGAPRNGRAVQEDEGRFCKTAELFAGG